MKYAVLSMCFAVSLTSIGGDADKKETGRLAGAWSLSELKYDGEEHKIRFKVVFKGNEGSIEGNDRVTDQYGKMKFKLDPSATPKAMDIIISAGSQTDATMKAIYELKDDELRICVAVFGDRPKEFAAPNGSSTALLVLKRAAK